MSKNNKMKNKTIEMKFKDIHDYILSDTETHYSTEQALDSLYRKLTWDKLNLLREYIDVNKLLNDHKWYLDYKEQMEKNLIQGIGLLLKKDKELNSQSKMIDSRQKTDGKASDQRYWSVIRKRSKTEPSIKND